MKKILRFGLFAMLCAALVLFSACTTNTGAAQKSDAVTELVVLHTNDHHGSIESKDSLGGLAQRAAYIGSIRDAYANVLLLDAGDINTGTAVSNMFKAEPDILAYNYMKYDAVAFGNHEFDGDLSLLEKQIKTAEFPFVSANVKKSNGKYLDSAYIVKEYDGVKVGVFGLTTRRALTIASPDKSLTFADEIETAKEMVAFLRNKKKADIVILLGHLGSVEEAIGQQTSVAIAQNVEGIDLIIDGHSHTEMKEPLVVNGTPIVSAWENGKIIGTAMLKIQGGKIVSLNWTPVSVRSDTMLADEGITNLVTPYLEKAAARLDNVVATATDEFVFGNRLSRYREIALGDMVCDGTMWYVTQKLNQNADFAFTNGGNIRAALPKGNITERDIATVLPFDNWLYILTMKGSQVIELFDFIGSINQGSGGFAQVSKEARYTITYDANGKNGKVSNVTVGGKPIDPEKTYRIVANDYVAGGGDGYVVLTKSSDTFNTSCTLRDAVVEYVQQLASPVDPNSIPDGRITIVGGVQN